MATVITKESLRKAMSQFATGVTVVTTLDDHGQPHAMTANSFTSVCLEPPVVLICVAHSTHTYKYLEHSRWFGINVLRQDQEKLGIYFAKRPADRHGEVDYSYSTSADGVPVLDGSMVSFVCQVMESHVAGDHTIYLGEVKEIREGAEGAPLLFFHSRWYHPSHK
ncbi:MAG: flavin reductase family protein [SAR202 cluster bacterium]|nr:flavin reductase family protein [SAR202 cluster bacterium]